MKKSVAVVGGGAAGLAACKELLAAGFEVALFDACDSVGGRWSSDRGGLASHGVWDELYMNTSRSMSEFSDFPWRGDDYRGADGVQDDFNGQFAHWTETRAYLQAYAEHCGLMPHIHLETRVTAMARRTDGSGWVLTTCSSAGEETTRELDAVVLCLGRYSVERNPLTQPGGSLADFTGEILHSGSLESLAAMDGKRVLVVGGSVSGADIAATLGTRGRATRVLHSLRRIPYVAVGRDAPSEHRRAARGGPSVQEHAEATTQGVGSGRRGPRRSRR